MKHRYGIQKVLGCGMALLMATACTDTWNDHYSVNNDMVSNQNSDKTLWDVIEGNAELEQFASLLEKVGFDTLLQKDRTYTVWAPVGQFDYTETDLELLKKEFVQNHIADFRHVAAGTLKNDNTVKMLNGKSLSFTGSTGAYAFNRVGVVGQPEYAKNGVLYYIGGNGSYSEFLPNIWEYFDKNPQIAKFNSYLKEFTDSTVNHTASEAGGSSINDLGQVEYVDTVWNVSNQWWNMVGPLHNEDSAYIVIAPTDAAWDKMYEKVTPYLRQDPMQLAIETTDDPDSLLDLKVKEYMCRHLVFSKKVNPDAEKYDSLVSNYQNYFDPVVFRGAEYEALFANQVGAPVELSNGTVHIVDQLNYLPTTTFLDTIKVEGENTNLCMQFRDQEAGGNTSILYAAQTVKRDSVYYSSMSNGSYMLAEQIKPSTVALTYTLPNAYAAKYRVKVVMVPATIQNWQNKGYKPAPITMKFASPNGKGGVVEVSSKEYKYTDYKYNDPELGYDAQRLDTITFVDKNGNDFVVLPYSEYGLNVDNCKTTLTITATQGRNDKNIDPAKDRTLRIDCIIMEPME